MTKLMSTPVIGMCSERRIDLDMSMYCKYVEEHEKRKRTETLLNDALFWIYEHTGFDDEEYLRICKNHLKMTEDELEWERIEIGL